MCKGTTTNTVTNSQPPGYIQQAYQNLVGRATNVANTPLTQYGGPMVAGFNPTQQAAFTGVNNSAGVAAPLINEGANMARSGAAPVWPGVTQFSQGQVDKYSSPYTQDVINATTANIDRSNAIQQNDLLGKGIASGNAFGGDRLGVAQAELARNQDLAKNQVVAGLNNQRYAQALGEFNNQQGAEIQSKEGDAWRQANAGYELGGLGGQLQSTGLAGASAQLQTGALGQQLQQEQLNVPYEQYLQAQAYPFQTTQFLGQMTGVAAGGAGGTSTTSQPGPSTLSQIGGLGLAGLGIAGATGGLGAGGWLSSLFKRGGRTPVEMFEHGGRVPYADGGDVANPGANAPVPETFANPMMAQRYADLSGQTQESLQRMAVMYPGSSPRGMMVRRALMAKQMAPASNQPAGGVAGQQPQGYAVGGATDPYGADYLPIVTSGGDQIAMGGVNPAMTAPPGVSAGVPRVRSPVDGTPVSRGVPQHQVSPGFRGAGAMPPAQPPVAAFSDQGAGGLDNSGGVAAPLDVGTGAVGGDTTSQDSVGVDPAADAGLDAVAMQPLPDAGAGVNPGDTSDQESRNYDWAQVPNATGLPNPPPAPAPNQGGGVGGAPLPPPTLKPGSDNAAAMAYTGEGRGWGAPKAPSDGVLSLVMSKGSTGSTSPGAQQPVPSWAMPLAMAGFAMMASRSPYAMQALGEGGMSAVNQYAQQRRYDLESAWRRAQMENQQNRTAIYDDIAKSHRMSAEAALLNANTKATTGTGMTEYQRNEIALRTAEMGQTGALRLDGMAQSAYDRGMSRIDNDVNTMSPGAAREAAVTALGQQIQSSYPKSALAISLRPAPPAKNTTGAAAVVPPGYTLVGKTKAGVPVYKSPQGQMGTFQ